MDDIKAAARKMALEVYDEWGECCTVEEMVAAIAAAILEAKAEALESLNLYFADRKADEYRQAAAEVRRGE